MQGRLPPEQEELLGVMVEAFRSVPRMERHPALLLDQFGSSSSELVHNGLAAIGKPNYQFYMGDAKELALRGLIRLESVGSGAYQADITNDGFSYYEHAKVARGQAIERVETTIVATCNPTTSNDAITPLLPNGNKPRQRYGPQTRFIK
jgi:hypothetical protein